MACCVPFPKVAAVHGVRPARGSGNFLYPALQALNDIEHRVQLEAGAMGLQRASPRRPRCQASIA